MKVKILPSLLISSLYLLGFLSIVQLSGKVAATQEFLPSPPTDRTPVYVLDRENKLVPLPFESGSTPLHSDAVAKETKTSYVEIKGEHAATILNDVPRWFLFTSQRAGAHPPFLVWLTPHKGARRVTVVAQKGLSGFAVSSAEIVKPSVRVLARLEGDDIFMEGRPRASLAPGEYAIIGNDLTRIATFRVALN
jgi:hypothetical protein